VYLAIGSESRDFRGHLLATAETVLSRIGVGMEMLLHSNGQLQINTIALVIDVRNKGSHNVILVCNIISCITIPYLMELPLLIPFSDSLIVYKMIISRLSVADMLNAGKV
jgi:hypothetical protein